MSEVVVVVTSIYRRYQSHQKKHWGRSLFIGQPERSLDELAGPYVGDDSLLFECLIVADNDAVDSQGCRSIQRIIGIVGIQPSSSSV